MNPARTTRVNLPETPISPRLPGAGAMLLLIPGVSDVAIAGSTVGPAVLYRWPGPFLVSAFWLWEQDTATAAAAANIRLRMQDSARNELVIDGAGTTTNAGALAFCGRSPRWQSFRRVVRAGQKWLFQIENTNAFQAVPQLYFKLESE